MRRAVDAGEHRLPDASSTGAAERSCLRVTGCREGLIEEYEFEFGHGRAPCLRMLAETYPLEAIGERHKIFRR